MSTIRVFAPPVKMAAAVARRPTPDLSVTVRRGTRAIPVETQVNWSESATDGKLLLLLLLLLLYYIIITFIQRSFSDHALFALNNMLL